MTAFIFEGAEVILPDRIAPLSLRIEEGVITGLDAPRDGARVIDASGLMLAPALVDIHGDAFERQVMPRSGVYFPLDVALMETDRQLAANGIATAYHALTLSWEPGLRSVERGREVVDGLARLAPRLAVENRVQLRWETFCFEAEDLITTAMAGHLAPSLAFNDHTTMAMLHPEIPLQSRPFDHAPDYPVADTGHPDFIAALDSRAQRSGLERRAYADLMAAHWARRDEVPASIAALAAQARGAGVPMLSHDDTQIETRSFYREHGAQITEFPMNLTVAQAAREGGDWIVFGAPNATRGGSHISGRGGSASSPGAGDMVARGLCDILASDYYYPAMLAAVARLHSETVRPLHELWKLISTNPARASGLIDRGEVALGQRADLVLLDWPEGASPAPVLTLSGGHVAHAARGVGCR